MRKVTTSCLTIVLLAGCNSTIVWKSGPQTFKQDDYACKRDAEGIRRSFSGLAAVGEDQRVRKMYIECMEARGYTRE